jgi:hypothetical protein
VGRGHHRDRRHPGEGPRGFDEEERPEAFALLGRGGGEDRGVFGHTDAVLPADLKFDLLDVGRAGRGRKDVGDHLPESIGIVHRLVFGCNPFGMKISVIFDVGVVVGPNVVDDLVAQGKDSFFMSDLILMDVDG